MSNNPYQTPQTENFQDPAYQDGRLTRQGLLRVAKDQKGILLCILVYLCMVIGQFAVSPEVRVFPAAIAGVAAITGAVFVFRLAIRIYSTALGVVLGILTLIPFLGLFVLLVVNGKATRILRDHGIKVGLLGADTSAI